MNDREIAKILDYMKYIPEGDERDDATSLVLKTASESITMERLRSITSKAERKASNGENGSGGTIKFTKKEIASMPDSIKKLFVVEDKIVSYRFIRGVYQARFRREGYNIEVASKDFGEMKRKFIAKLLQVEKEKEKKKFPLFKDFVADWLKAKQHLVKETTFTGYVNLLNHDILPKFGEMSLNEITRQDVQDFLFAFVEAGKNRTSQKSRQLLSAVFDVVHDDYNIKSPVKNVVLPHYEVEKGKAFTLEEEKTIVDFCRQNPDYYGNDALLVMLYTGMRVGELASINYDGQYVTCVSEKTRKGYADVVRKIPISPMFKRVIDLVNFDKVKMTKRDTIRDGLKRIFPTRHVHEFRYTFISRAKECGILGEVVMLWAGHESDCDVKTSKVDRGYTTFSEQFLLNEMAKHEYAL